MKVINAILLLTWLLAMTACAKSEAPASGGSESHFLAACQTSSECGSPLSCIADVCTIECESDVPCLELDDEASCDVIAGAGPRACNIVAASLDAATLESEPLGASELLDEPYEMAFIEGTYGDEQLWLRGEHGALTKISVWPADEAWQQGWCAALGGFSGYVSGFGRFDRPIFDSSTRYLVFIENQSCEREGEHRIVVHELITGLSWSVATLSGYVSIAAGPYSMVVSTRAGETVTLYDLDPEERRVTRLDSPSGNLLNGASLDVIHLGPDEEVVMAVGLPVLRKSPEGVAVFEPIDSLGPDLQLGDLGSSTGDELCIGTRSVRDGPEIDAAQAVIIDGEQTSIHDITGFSSTCAFSRSGSFVMFGNTPFDLAQGEVVPRSLPSERMNVDGSLGEQFYGTRADGEVVRFDPATSQTDVLISSEALDLLCDRDAHELSATRLYVSTDDRRMAIVHYYCGNADLGQAVILAIDLETGAYTTIEDSGTDSFATFDVVWGPRLDAVYVFSPIEGQRQPAFMEISLDLEVVTHEHATLEGMLHSPALPR